MSTPRTLRLATALGLWVTLGLVGAFYATWLGYGGRRFAIALAVWMLLLGGQLLTAAGDIRTRAVDWLASPGRAFAAVVLPLLAYLIYAAGTNTFEWRRAALCVGYVLAPSLLAFRARQRPPGRWEDYAAALLIWLPVEFRWLRALWPYPQPMGYMFTTLLAVNVAVMAFLLIRRLEGVGYTIAWDRGWGWTVGLNFVIFAAIAIPLGEAIGFLTFAPSYERFRTLPLTALGILVFTAWPEELLFRGLLQNLLSRTFRKPFAGWMAASVVFGLAHINNGPFPNWRYVLLATIAGIFYGRAWMKTGSIFASCLVHALVDALWHVLFR